MMTGEMETPEKDNKNKRIKKFTMSMNDEDAVSPINRDSSGTNIKINLNNFDEGVDDYT